MGLRSSVWPLSISLAATLEIEFSFSSCRYLDVSVHDVPSIALCIYAIVTGLFPAGFPHSDICGSPAMCALPQLFAACHVLLRLLVPRHPPYALLRLINSSACPMLNCVSSSMKPSVSSHNLPPSAFFHAKPLFEVILFFGSFLSLLKLIFSRTESSSFMRYHS